MVIWQWILKQDAATHDVLCHAYCINNGSHKWLVGCALLDHGANVAGGQKARSTADFLGANGSQHVDRITICNLVLCPCLLHLSLDCRSATLL